MKRYSILSLLFIFFALGVVAQVDSLILPFGATTLTDEQKASNPDYLAYPLMLASQVGEIRCNEIMDCMEYVDLGLSVMWATCNIGASTFNAYGNYFAWGEIESKEQYDWNTYKYCEGTYNTLTKYCANSSFGQDGFKDKNRVLDNVDDVATINWGGNWRIPTELEFRELANKCIWKWVDYEGIEGCKVTGPNGNSIFFPAGGYIEGTTFYDKGLWGYYCTSILGISAMNSSNTANSQCATLFEFSRSAKRMSVFGQRSIGVSVRPVYDKNKSINMVYVDLGLSVNWATCNVGAKNPEDYGEYFAWGEVKSKEFYDWSTYKYCKGTNKTMTKYCTDKYSGDNGFTDNKKVLELKDDVAYVSLRGNWRMPTDAEFTELREKCQWTWTMQNEVVGYKVVGPNGNSIFLPACGYKSGDRYTAVSSAGYYWSSSLSVGVPSAAFSMFFYSSNYKTRECYYRCSGFVVRPVYPKKQQYEYHAYVDLGLSVKWATCNVGAEIPEDYGDYFAWGETKPKSKYDWTTYKYCKGTDKTMTKYSTNRSYGNNGFTDNKTVLDPEDDAATVNWGGAWRMPTDAEFTELREQCKWTWTTQNGVNGYKVVGPNGNSIFLPAAGYVSGTSLSGVGYRDCCYWSSSLNTSSPYYAYFVRFDSSNVSRKNCNRYCGHSVRPVCQ